jgi:hypothetical protein
VLGQELALMLAMVPGQEPVLMLATVPGQEPVLVLAMVLLWYIPPRLYPSVTQLTLDLTKPSSLTTTSFKNFERLIDRCKPVSIYHIAKTYITPSFEYLDTQYYNIFLRKKFLPLPDEAHYLLP